MPAPKSPWASKTLWAAVLVAVVPTLPYAQDWIDAHAHAYSFYVALLFAGLRFMTAQPLGGTKK